MRKEKREAYRQKLADMARELRGRVDFRGREGLRPSGGRASGSESNIPVHPADLANDQFEQEMTLGMMEAEGARLEEVNAALQRIDEGGYGVCEACGADIAEKRLDVVPYTRYCIDCAEELEKKGPTV